MGGQPNGSSAPLPRRWQIVRCGGLSVSQVSHLSLCSLGVNGLRTPPPPWVTLRPFLFLVVLLLTYVLGYDFWSP